MSKETMTSEERVWAAVRLEKPDRVPSHILATAAFTKTVGGTTGDWYTNEDKSWVAIDKVWDYTGGWDMMITVAAMSTGAWKLASALGMLVKLRIPGVDLPDDYTLQAVEEEVLKPGDYDTICEIGWDKFLNQDYLFRITDFTPEGVAKALDDQAIGGFRGIEMWNSRGVMQLIPCLSTMHPFFRLSVGRSMVKFMEDVYYSPEKVEKALKVVTREAIEQWIAHCKMLNQKTAFIAEERSCGFFFPLNFFERFWWPYTQEIVEALWSEGIVTWFHLDQCWDKNIPYFKKLPRGSAILALDGTTNIFAAKETLRGHLCLAGDVQPALMSLGKPEDVEAYCRKLIDEVGGDGGFILNTGCEMPTAVKLDNWRAMVQTARDYELSKKR
jgi:uroporphyrinogen-III decarboxylase